MRRISILLTIILLGHGFMMAQQPQVRNFSPQEYHGGTQNWCAIQSPSDRMFFGNNEGIMVFDGDRWATYKVDNYTAVRTAYFDQQDNRIYVGASDELGYFEPDTEQNTTTYHSLISLLPQEHRSFGEIWNVFRAGKRLVFQSKTDIFIYTPGEDKMKVANNGMRQECAALIGNRVVVAGRGGVFTLQGVDLQPLPATEPLRGLVVRAILPYGREVLFVTSDNGVFAYDGQQTVPMELPVSPYLKENQVFCAAVQDSVLAFGTVRGGLVIYDQKNRRPTYANVNTGLGNNTVLSAMFDNDHNVWVGLDYGLAYVLNSSPYANLLGTHSHIGTGYASAVYGGKLYLGTGQGLFVTDYPIVNSPVPSTPLLLPGMTGQVWTLDKINGTLFCGNDNGAYTVNGTTTRRIGGVEGAWKFMPMPRHPDCVLGCDYRGFLVLRKQGDSYVLSHRIHGLDIVSGGFYVDDDGSIWISHWQKGIYHVWLNDDLTAVTRQEHFHKGNCLLVDEGNLLCRIDGRIYVSTVDGLYHYDKSTKKLVHDSPKGHIFDDYGVALHIFQSPEHDLWAYRPGFMALARKGKDGGYAADKLTYQPAANNLQTVMGDVCFMDSQHALFNAQDGFFVLNNSYRDHSKPRSTYIRSVTSTNNGDSLLFLNLLPESENQHIRIPKKENSIRIEFIQTEYRSDEAVNYSCLLDGYDKEWSEPQLQTSKEYTRLPKGHYTFRLRAFNRLTGKTDEVAYDIEILPAWYETWWAYALYLLLAAGAVYLLVQGLKHRQERKLNELRIQQEREMRRQQAEFELEQHKKESEVARLKNEQLETELKHRQSELGDSTMNLMRKNDMLQALDTQLNELSESVRREDAKAKITQKIRDIRHDIQSNINEDEGWDKFEENFNLVYDNFMKQLTTQFPELKMNDRKLCAYLRMGLSSKEMASLLNTSVRSIETARYRLRKKLGIGQGDNLTEFIQSFNEQTA